MKQKTSAVYRIFNKLNGKLYYGSSCHIEERFYRHKLHLNKGKHENPYLQNAWNKYGESAFLFEIVESCPKENLTKREQFYMNSSRSTERDYGYNIAPLADRPPMTEETKKKIGDANRGKPTWIKGKHHSAKTRAKMSISGKLTNHMRGKTGSQHHLFGKHHSEETKKKMSSAKKGKFNNCSSKAVHQIKDGIIVATYPSLEEATRQTNVNSKNISACVTGKRPKAGGFEWTFSNGHSS